MRTLLLFSIAAVLFGATAAPSQAPAKPDMTPPFTVGGHRDTDPSFEAEIKHKQEKELNLQRQQEIKKDTDRLLELATQLKQSVDHSNENTLSLEVVRKAEEIEKLAREVKQKMKSGS